MQTNTPRPIISRRIGLARRTRQRLQPLELRLRLDRVVAAEIDRLAHFGDAIVQRLAALAREDGDQPVRLALHRVGHGFENVRALRPAERIPVRLDRPAPTHRPHRHPHRVAGATRADDTLVIRRRLHRHRHAAVDRLARDDRADRDRPRRIQLGDLRLRSRSRTASWLKSRPREFWREGP